MPVTGLPESVSDVLWPPYMSLTHEAGVWSLATPQLHIGQSKLAGDFRYDMNPALGLRLEYGRFGRFAGEVPSGPPESEQVSVGLQLRF